MREIKNGLLYDTEQATVKVTAEFHEDWGGDEASRYVRVSETLWLGSNGNYFFTASYYDDGVLERLWRRIRGTAPLFKPAIDGIQPMTKDRVYAWCLEHNIPFAQAGLPDPEIA